MTEAEASECWCPMYRVSAGPRSPLDGSSNRTGSCIGSKCMAWRWSNHMVGHDLAYHIRQAGGDEQRARENHRRFLRGNPLDGYCGLAGKP